MHGFPGTIEMHGIVINPVKTFHVVNFIGISVIIAAFAMLMPKRSESLAMQIAGSAFTDKGFNRLTIITTVLKGIF